ncbi:MAG: DUF1028 domain-containing protein [Saccharolobus sp.]|uniref:Putative peptidoglycan binding domain-containing protein n=2 Tax=Saccharolobus shibatae TaxID=2286 RepID=A0A8F5GT65_SACSH|nr:DUF1028 domain-containing protein [Saccharolobus shibatae]MCH4816310.1 DUF1028 domain-containing protein [Saccharolobus shibatae]QXJ28619.1 Uncharacterized protein J5U23_01488 [Saccharolobus shibatae B12]QXJ31997.1 Uncharacterized protein J5U21_01648 [Saccharolobus shibatae]
MTFSIVIYDPEEKAWGVGVASKFLAVGAFVPWLRPNVGAIATQALANLTYGVNGLSLLEKGYSASDTIRILTDSDPLREKRQIGVVDSKGNASAFTGKECYSYAGHIIGDHFSVQGNILAGEEVLEAMAKEAEGRGRIYEKILRSLKAGESKGGDRRGKQSASIIVVKAVDKSEREIDPLTVGKYVDLRVDDSQDPLKDLERLLDLWVATFMEEEMVNVKDYEDKIRDALRKWGYNDLRTWVEMNNFEGKYTGDRIGKSVLKILLSKE